MSRARHPPRPTLHVSDPHPPHSRSLTHTRHSHPCSFSHPPLRNIARDQAALEPADLGGSHVDLIVGSFSRVPFLLPTGFDALDSCSQTGPRLRCSRLRCFARPDESHGNGALLPVVTAGSLSSSVAPSIAGVSSLLPPRRSFTARRSPLPDRTLELNERMTCSSIWLQRLRPAPSCQPRPHSLAASRWLRSHGTLVC